MEERRIIKGYEEIYEITSSGRIYTYRSMRFLERCGDEYGFHIVSLWDNDRNRKNWNVFKLWQEAFPELPKEQFKGSLKIKYGKSCELRQTQGIHYS
ncbi:NUMOD4 domain-containing protein [Peribacillus acanthi]|uniref:NUMOD4 domain-containing protein n=1 Tax=Peribacillus acanthi TaxID=2171554 RepID=UPI000D3E40C9|nr:NUMOD4 domain-containing protein [Peribacillus acanthi]